MIISLDKYTIQEEENKITIYLPQTTETTRDTITPVARRRIKLNDTELSIILHYIKCFYESEEQ